MNTYFAFHCLYAFSNYIAGIDIHNHGSFFSFLFFSFLFFSFLFFFFRYFIKAAVDFLLCSHRYKSAEGVQNEIPRFSVFLWDISLLRAWCYSRRGTVNILTPVLTRQGKIYENAFEAAGKSKHNKFVFCIQPLHRGMGYEFPVSYRTK